MECPAKQLYSHVGDDLAGPPHSPETVKVAAGVMAEHWISSHVGSGLAHVPFMSHAIVRCPTSLYPGWQLKVH